MYLALAPSVPRLTSPAKPERSAEAVTVQLENRGGRVATRRSIRTGAKFRMLPLSLLLLLAPPKVSTA